MFVWPSDSIRKIFGNGRKSSENRQKLRYYVYKKIYIYTRSLVRYRAEHSKKNFISPRTHVLISICYLHACLPAGAWIPKVQSTSQYLQIDLLQVRNISAIMTQGRDGSGCSCSEWVTEYKLSYSLCGSFWSEYKANGSIKVRLFYHLAPREAAWPSGLVLFYS